MKATTQSMTLDAALRYHSRGLCVMKAPPATTSQAAHGTLTFSQLATNERPPQSGSGHGGERTHAVRTDGARRDTLRPIWESVRYEVEKLRAWIIRARGQELLADAAATAVE